MVGGQRVRKDNLRIEAFGTVDELNAFVGATCVTLQDQQSDVCAKSMLYIVKHASHYP